MADPIGCKPSGGRGLLIHGGALGDFILALRVAEAVRAAGAAKITVLARSAATELRAFLGVERVLNLDVGGFHTLFAAEFPAASQVRRDLAGFDLTVNMLGGDGGRVAERLREVT